MNETAYSRISRTIGAVVILVALGVLYVVNPAQSRWVLKCPFKMLTGYNCPGCGTQRAVHAFFHGHLLEALHYNYCLLLIVPYLLALAAERLLLTGERQERWRQRIENKHVATFYIATCFLWFFFRNVWGL